MDYMTDHARLARARRFVVQAEFVDQVHGPFRMHPMIDTGAPFSVIPFSIRHRPKLEYTPLGDLFTTLEGEPEPSALAWLGVPCELGEVKVTLVDELKNRSRSLRMVAKLPRSPVASHMEKTVVVGCSFLADNNLTLTLHPASRTTLGSLTDVVGFLHMDS
jgi:hypothetical protein